MARTLLGPLQRAIVVENPSSVLDEQLRAAGVTVTRADTPSTDELIALIQQTGAQAIFKRSRVAVSRRVIESCPTAVLHRG